jgi:hypothetical protein
MIDGGVRIRVPVAEVAGEASRAVFLRVGLLLEVGWLPLLILLAASILPQLGLVYLAPKPTPGALAVLPDVIATAVAVLCLCAFAVRWAQIAAPGADAVSGIPFWLVWWRFIIVTLPLTLSSAVDLILSPATEPTAASIAAMPPSAHAVLVLTIIVVDILPWLLMARVALLLPAAARGQTLGLAVGWRLMQGNSWRLVGAVCLACLPLVMLSQLTLSGLGSSADDPVLGAILLRGLIETLENVILTALAISIASGFYRRIAILSRI